MRWEAINILSIKIGAKLVKNVIERCIVSSDSEEIIDIALKYTQIYPLKEINNIASDESKVIDYVLDALERLQVKNNIMMPY